MTESQKWKKIEEYFALHFTSGETPDLDAILFLIGVQELGQGPRKFSKDEKINLLHIAVARILEPYGYYAFTERDKDGWPHFQLKVPIPELKPNEQSIFIRKAIIDYVEEQVLLDFSQ